MSNKNYGGIDVAKQNVVIGIFGYPKTKTEANNPNGHTNTVEYLKKHNVNLAVLESTGGLEVPLANALYAAGMRVGIAVNQRAGCNHFGIKESVAASFSCGFVFCVLSRISAAHSPRTPVPVAWPAAWIQILLLMPFAT